MMSRRLNGGEPCGVHDPGHGDRDLGQERDPVQRPTASQLGQALDHWVFAQQEVATPDKLEAHLAQLFPGSYQPPTVDDEETEFTNLKAALNRSWWKKSLGV